MKLLKGSSPEAWELVKALGIDTLVTRRITLTLDAGDIARLDVEMYVKEDCVPGLVKVLKNYKLVEIE